MNNLIHSMHSSFEAFVVKNKLDFSLVRAPKIKDLNNYIESDTAQIFDVYSQGFKAAVEYKLTKGNKDK